MTTTRQRRRRLTLERHAVYYYYFPPSSPALAVRFAFAVRPIVTTDVVSRDAAAAPCPGVGDGTGVAKCRTGLLGGKCGGRSIPRTPRTANVQRTKQAEPVVSRPSGKPPVRYRCLPYFISFLNIFLDVPRKRRNRYDITF